MLGPPKLRLITWAGFGLFGVFGTGRPAAQRIPFAISCRLPPHFPKTRTGIILVLNDIPAPPILLFVNAAIVPATWVPCQELFCGANGHQKSLFETQSPGSLASASGPSPSLATLRFEIKSYPGNRLPARSSCGL